MGAGEDSFTGVNGNWVLDSLLGPSEKVRALPGVWEGQSTNRCMGQGCKSSRVSSRRMGAEDRGGARVADSSRHWGPHTELWDGHFAF